MLKQALGASGYVAGLTFLEVAIAQSSPAWTGRRSLKMEC